MRDRHGVDSDDLRIMAEQVAYAMTADQTIGLNPRRGELAAALVRQGFRIPRLRLFKVLDALEYMKLGRSDNAAVRERERQFTFSHRRFQEFFATSVVIADRGRVAARQLLVDARWRETAVVLCQTGTHEEITPLAEAAAEILGAALASGQKPVAVLWMPRVTHVLGILQAGFQHESPDLTANVRALAAEILVAAFGEGDLLEKKLALEVAGTVPTEVLLRLLRDALDVDSQWLNDTAYRQIARLPDLPEDILKWMRQAILRLSLTGQAARDERYP